MDLVCVYFVWQTKSFGCWGYLPLLWRGKSHESDRTLPASFCAQLLSWPTRVPFVHKTCGVLGG